MARNTINRGRTQFIEKKGGKALNSLTKRITEGVEFLDLSNLFGVRKLRYVALFALFALFSIQISALLHIPLVLPNSFDVALLILLFAAAVTEKGWKLVFKQFSRHPTSTMPSHGKLITNALTSLWLETSLTSREIRAGLVRSRFEGTSFIDCIAPYSDKALSILNRHGLQDTDLITFSPYWFPSESSAQKNIIRLRYRLADNTALQFWVPLVRLLFWPMDALKYSLPRERRIAIQRTFAARALQVIVVSCLALLGSQVLASNLRYIHHARSLAAKASPPNNSGDRIDIATIQMLANGSLKEATTSAQVADQLAVVNELNKYQAVKEAIKILSNISENEALLEPYMLVNAIYLASQLGAKTNLVKFFCSSLENRGYIASFQEYIIVENHCNERTSQKLRVRHNAEVKLGIDYLTQITQDKINRDDSFDEQALRKHRLLRVALSRPDRFRAELSLMEPSWLVQVETVLEYCRHARKTEVTNQCDLVARTLVETYPEIGDQSLPISLATAWIDVAPQNSLQRFFQSEIKLNNTRRLAAIAGPFYLRDPKLGVNIAEHLNLRCDQLKSLTDKLQCRSVSAITLLRVGLVRRSEGLVFESEKLIDEMTDKNIKKELNCRFAIVLGLQRNYPEASKALDGNVSHRCFVKPTILSEFLHQSDIQLASVPIQNLLDN